MTLDRVGSDTFPMPLRLLERFTYSSMLSEIDTDDGGLASRQRWPLAHAETVYILDYTIASLPSGPEITRQDIEPLDHLSWTISLALQHFPLRNMGSL